MVVKQQILWFQQVKHLKKNNNKISFTVFYIPSSKYGIYKFALISAENKRTKNLETLTC